MDEDIKYFVYLVFAIIYFLFFRKKKPKKGRPAQPTSTESTESETTVTFEDLLREFGADIPKAEKPSPDPIPVEPVNIPDDDYAQEVYRKSVESAKQPVPVADIIRQQQHEHEFERDDHYKIEEHENPLAQKLKNPESLRDAIIFNEILNRKYD